MQLSAVNYEIIKNKPILITYDEIIHSINIMKSKLNTIQLIEEKKPNTIIYKFRDKMPHYNKYQSIYRIITIKLEPITSKNTKITVNIEPYNKENDFDVESAKLYWVDFVYQLLYQFDVDSKHDNELYTLDMIQKRLEHVNSRKGKILDIVGTWAIFFTIAPIVLVYFSLWVLGRSMNIDMVVYTVVLVFFSSLLIYVYGNHIINNELKKLLTLMEKIN